MKSLFRLVGFRLAARDHVFMVEGSPGAGVTGRLIEIIRRAAPDESANQAVRQALLAPHPTRGLHDKKGSFSTGRASAVPEF